MRALAAAAALSVILAPAAAPAQEVLGVVATTGMIADAAARIGGDLVAVQGLMGPGVDPHGYRQTRSDIVATASADLVLWHGLRLEAQMQEFLRDLSQTRRVVAVAEGLAPDLLIGSADYPGQFDPHVWMDPALWSQVVGHVSAALAEAMPGQEAALAASTAAYLDEIADLDAYAREVLASVPEASRVLVTAHDAFGYFGAAYGFEVVGIQGISTESEAGLQRIGEVVDLLVARDIGAVFVESSVSDRNIRALIEGAAARGHEVVIGGALFSDAMGAAGTHEGTWIGMIEHNVTLIARALGGTAPERGVSGLLAVN